MKQRTITLLALTFICSSSINAQAINWAEGETSKKHIINLHADQMHGINFGAGYSYEINRKWIPVRLAADFSAAAGDDLTDDFKAKTGGNIRWAAYRNIHLSSEFYGIFRRYENELVRQVNFGAEVNGIAGYYRPRWFAAAAFGFDKAIVTHFRHSEAYKAQFPGVEDGWYEPPAGGNFHYGLQAGCSFGPHDVYIKAGKTVAQDFKTKPQVPVYGQLGYNLKF